MALNLERNPVQWVRYDPSEKQKVLPMEGEPTEKGTRLEGAFPPRETGLLAAGLMLAHCQK